MKIIHVIPGLNPSSGPSQVVAHLGRYQAAQGHDVTICYVSGRGTEPTDGFPESISVYGFRAKLARQWAYSPDLAAFLDEEAQSADILHLHSMWLYPNIAGSRAARAAGVPYIVRPAGSLEPWCFEGSLKKRIYLELISRRILDNAARIHAVSEQEAAQIESLRFTSRTVVVPNGIETDIPELHVDRAKALEQLNWPAAKTHILFLSRIHPKKGLGFLLDVFEAIDPDRLDARLIVAGPDQHPYAARMKARAQENRHAHRIHFIGEVLGKTKWHACRAADLLVLPSNSENFGNVVLESLAAGTPVIVSQNTPWKIVQDRGAGYWLPLSMDMFRDTIIKCLGSGDERSHMRHEAQKIALDFAWPAIAEKLTEVYEEACCDSG